MIVRCVRMTFKRHEAARFLELFEDWRKRIITMPGCMHLELWGDTDDERVFTTYSLWRSEGDLEHYRRSDVFNVVWPTVKKLFDAPPLAWSNQVLITMDPEATA